MTPPPPPHTQIYEDAVSVTPVSSHEYSANLHPDWTIGAVPHGGYTTAILYRLATTHFKHTLPKQHNSDPMPISMQMTFLHRTAVGPAMLKVEDSKLGLRTSTIHVTLSQEDEAEVDQNGGGTESKKRTVRVVGYITVSDPLSDVGVSSPSAWTLYPPAPSQRPPEVVLTVDGLSTKTDGTTSGTEWKVSGPSTFSKFRRVEHQCITFEPNYDGDHGNQSRPGILDQWARLRTTDFNSSSAPTGDDLVKELGKWTNDTIPFLSDWFPIALAKFGTRTAAATAAASSSANENKLEQEKSKIPKFWFPTVTLNIDFKKRLPPQGVDWLYSRVVMKNVQNGRMDIEVIIMDEEGDIVALCSHIGLVVDVARNTSGRKYDKSNGGSKTKL